MEPSYSVVADWLSKFHTWPAFIQMLWLVAPLAALLGTTWLVMRGLRDLALVLLARPGVAQGRSIYAIHETPDGRCMLYARGKVRELPCEDLPDGPPPLLRHRGGGSDSKRPLGRFTASGRG